MHLMGSASHGLGETRPISAASRPGWLGPLSFTVSVSGHICCATPSESRHPRMLVYGRYDISGPLGTRGCSRPAQAAPWWSLGTPATVVGRGDHAGCPSLRPSTTALMLSYRMTFQVKGL